MNIHFILYEIQNMVKTERNEKKTVWEVVESGKQKSKIYSKLKIILQGTPQSKREKNLQPTFRDTMEKITSSTKYRAYQKWIVLRFKIIIITMLALLRGERKKTILLSKYQPEQQKYVCFHSKAQGKKTGTAPLL